VGSLAVGLYSSFVLAIILLLAGPAIASPTKAEVLCKSCWPLLTIRLFSSRPAVRAANSPVSAAERAGTICRRIIRSLLVRDVEFLTADGWQIEGEQSSFGHDGCGGRGYAKHLVLATDLLRESRGNSVLDALVTGQSRVAVQRQAEDHPAAQGNYPQASRRRLGVAAISSKPHRIEQSSICQIISDHRKESEVQAA
jgi:hypothetical protein